VQESGNFQTIELQGLIISRDKLQRCPYVCRFVSGKLDLTQKIIYVIDLKNKKNILTYLG
jgi:hypothetical protein